MASVSIFGVILRTDEFDTISADHRVLYQRSDLGKMNQLYDLKK